RCDSGPSVEHQGVSMQLISALQQGMACPRARTSRRNIGPGTYACRTLAQTRLYLPARAILFLAAPVTAESDTISRHCPTLFSSCSPAIRPGARAFLAPPLRSVVLPDAQSQS